MVASCPKAFDLRPKVAKVDKGIRLLDTKNEGPCHTPLFNRSDGRFQCSASFRSSDSELTGICKPILAASHLVWAAGDCIFCILCGAHSRVNVRKLGRLCLRKVSSTSMRSALERLRQGLHPTRPLFVGVPTPFLLRSATIQGFGDEESDVEF